MGSDCWTDVEPPAILSRPEINSTFVHFSRNSSKPAIISMTILMWAQYNPLPLFRWSRQKSDKYVQIPHWSILII